MKRLVVGALGWVLAVVVATTVGLAAVSLLSGDLTSGSMTPLSREAVENAATGPGNGGAPAPPSPTAEPGRTPTATRQASEARSRSFGSPGGTVIARCTGKTAYLVSWSPAQGWGVDEHERGPARSTLVKFEGESETVDDEKVTITVTCRSGEPIPAIVTRDD